MSFNSGFQTDYEKSGSGEQYGNKNIVLAHKTFEDGLKVGRFAKVDTGRLDNLDGSSTPVIAGVVLRTPTLTIENDATIEAVNHVGAVSYVENGLVTVDVKTGETPAYKGTVYASNAGDANDGLAQAVATNGVDTGAVFIEEIKAGVWLISQK